MPLPLSKHSRIACLLVCTLALLFAKSAQAADQKPLQLVDGDRIALVGNAFIDRMQDDGYLETLLTRRFPQVHLVFRNLGWAGDTVYRRERPLNFGNLKDHLAAVRPTVIFVSYGTMESLDGLEKLPRFTAKYGQLFDELASTSARIVVLGCPEFEYFEPQLMHPEERNGVLAAYNEAAAKLATARGARFASLEGLIHETMPWTKRAVWKPAYGFTTNGIHLKPAGYFRAAKMIEARLGLDASPWSCKLDLAQRRVTAHGATAYQFAVTPDGIRFRLFDDMLPTPRPPLPPRPLAHGLATVASSRTLVTSGLDPGRYELLIDGKHITVATQRTGERQCYFSWQASPEFDDAEKLRQEINRKNQLWFFRYRPHNGEYVYGRRSKSFEHNSGNEQFPAEMKELDAMIAEAEDTIHKLAQPVPHTYEIKRVAAEEK